MASLAGLFGGAPAQAKLPPMPVAPKIDDNDVQAKEREARKRAMASSRSHSDNIFTSSVGVMGVAPTATRTLLGGDR